MRSKVQWLRLFNVQWSMFNVPTSTFDLERVLRQAQDVVSPSNHETLNRADGATLNIEP